MELYFAPKGVVQIDNCRITWKNFSGEKFGKGGTRSFGVIVPNQELADQLASEGWDLKVREPSDPDDTPLIILPVKVKFNNYGPNVYLVTGNRKNKLSEDSIECLDHIDIQSVDLDIRPYDHGRPGTSGRSAYVQAMKVIQRIDRFADDLAESEYPGEPPF